MAPRHPYSSDSDCPERQSRPSRSNGSSAGASASKQRGVDNIVSTAELTASCCSSSEGLLEQDTECIPPNVLPPPPSPTSNQATSINDDNRQSPSNSKCDESTTHNSSMSSLTFPQHFQGVAVGIPAEEVKVPPPSNPKGTKPAAQAVGKPNLKRGSSDTGTSALEASRQRLLMRLPIHTKDDDDEDDNDDQPGVLTGANKMPERPAKPVLRRGISDTSGALETSSLHTRRTTPYSSQNGRRGGMVRTWSQPVMSSSTPDGSLGGWKKNGKFKLSPTRGPNPTIGPGLLRRQCSMKERVNKLRSAASHQPRRVKKSIHRSKSDGSESNHPMEPPEHLIQTPKRSSRKKKSRSLTNSPISRNSTNQLKPGPTNGLSRRMSLPTAAFRQAVNRSLLDNNNHQNPRIPDTISTNTSTVGADSAEEEDSEDVLLLIAKARAKLAMEGDTDAEAQAVLAQMTEQQQQQSSSASASREEREQQKVEASGSSIHSGVRSTTSSHAGTASLPGAYEKVPGGGFERKESFSHASISRHSASALMRQNSASLSASKQQPHTPQQSVNNSEIDSISSGDGDDMSDIMEIEFSQQSISNHDNDDNDTDEDDSEGDSEGAKKPAPKARNKIKDIQHVASSGSLNASLASKSLHPQDVFEDKKPAAKQEADMAAASHALSNDQPNKETEAQSNSERSMLASYTSFPSSAAAASAPTALIDNDSDDSSAVRRRRRRRRRSSGRRHSLQEGDHRRRRSYDKRSIDKKRASMKDDSNGSTSQLVIAAEVVRSEEEMVQELRQKVEKEILESMAKELNEMEASMSAFSSADFSLDKSQALSADMSHYSFDTSQTAPMPSPRRRRRMSRNNWQQRAASDRGFEIPPSPMSTSLQVQSGRRQPSDVAAASGAQSKVTPNQSRRLRSLNLSGASPRFLLGGRGRSLKKQHLPGQKAKPLGMPRLPTSTSGSSGDDSSSSSSEDDSTDAPSRRHSSMDIVDAVNVVPASPAAPARSQSQPVLRAVSSVPPRLPTTQPVVPPSLPFRQGSLLDQLRTMTNAGAASASGGPGQATASAEAAAVTATVATTQSPTPPTNLQREESGQSSLPDLTTPPPLAERTSSGSVIVPSNASNVPQLPQPQLETINSQQQLESLQNEVRMELERVQTPPPSQSQQHQTLHSSNGSLPHGHSSSGSLNLAAGTAADTDGYAGDETEFRVQNTHLVGSQPVPGMPTDWDLHQLELAELGQQSWGPFTGRLPSVTNLMASLQVDNTSADVAELPVMIGYDNQTPMAYLTPVGLLVVGAVVLGIVLFAV